VGMIPPYDLQTVQFGDCGGGRDKPHQTLLIFFRKNKPRAHGMFALEWRAGEDTDAAGLLNTEQDAASLLFATGEIATSLDFQTNLLEHCGRALNQTWTLGDSPSFEAGAGTKSLRIFANRSHAGDGHIRSQLALNVNRTSVSMRP
jgi:hypothetical protein